MKKGLVCCVCNPIAIHGKRRHVQLCVPEAARQQYLTRFVTLQWKGGPFKREGFVSEGFVSQAV